MYSIGSSRGTRIATAIGVVSSAILVLMWGVELPDGEGATANPLCPNTSLGQAEAVATALHRAAQKGFEDAAVQSARLLTPEELRASEEVELIQAVECVWWVSMSGHKEQDRYFPAVEAPAEALVWIEMKVGLESMPGGDLVAEEFTSAPSYPTRTAAPPTHTPTVGTSPTPTSTIEPPQDD
jgi:hypothetical protein